MGIYLCHTAETDFKSGNPHHPARASQTTAMTCTFIVTFFAGKKSWGGHDSRVRPLKVNLGGSKHMIAYPLPALPYGGRVFMVLAGDPGGIQ